MNRIIEGLLKTSSILKLREAVADKDVKKIEINGLYCSAKAYAVAYGISRGVHLVILDSKDDAEGCVDVAEETADVRVLAVGMHPAEEVVHPKEGH